MSQLKWGGTSVPGPDGKWHRVETPVQQNQDRYLAGTRPKEEPISEKDLELYAQLMRDRHGGT